MFLILTTRRWNLAAAKSQFIIKRIDGEPLTRRIIQFDLLEEIFNDKTACFMDGSAPTAPKISFGDLYRKTLMNSSKMTGSQRAKMEHTPDFGTVMAQVCMLVNVGRINTTLACEHLNPPPHSFYYTQSLTVFMIRCSLSGHAYGTSDVSFDPSSSKKRGHTAAHV